MVVVVIEKLKANVVCLWWQPGGTLR